jgi:VWFA-related protein
MRTHAFPLRPLLALAILVAIVGAALRPGPLAAQANSRERTMFISAVDGDGEPVEGLGPEAFIITEDGRRREILRVSRASEPIDIALLVDNSQAASDEITFLRTSLAKFVATMAPGNHIAVITLADRPTITTDYTADPKRLSDAVGRLFSMGQSGATLLDAIVETAQGLRKRETPRAAIVPVITDGVEFSNRYSRDVTRALVEARAALHLVTIGLFAHTDEHSIRERSFLLDEGPRLSGGHRTNLLSPTGLDPALQRLARELKSQYKVVYGRPESLIPPEKIAVSSGKTGVTMRGTPARGGNGA